MGKAQLYGPSSVVMDTGKTVSLRVPPLMTPADRVAIDGEYRELYLNALLPHLARAGVRHISQESFLWYADISCYQPTDYIDFDISVQTGGGIGLAKRLIKAFKLDTWGGKKRPWSLQYLPFPVGARSYLMLRLLTRNLGDHQSGLLLTELIGYAGRAPHEAGVLLFGSDQEQAHLRHGLELACVNCERS